MQINLSSKQKIIIGGVVGFLVIVGAGYYWYTSKSEGSPESAGSFQKSLLTKDVKGYMDARDKIFLKPTDFSFKEKEIYPLLKDYFQDISPKVPEGRANPFVPYAP